MKKYTYETIFVKKRSQYIPFYKFTYGSQRGLIPAGVDFGENMTTATVLSQVFEIWKRGDAKLPIDTKILSVDYWYPGNKTSVSKSKFTNFIKELKRP